MESGITQTRPISDEEIPAVARLWFDGWQDAHANILPRDLAKHRTLESFIDRLYIERDNVFVCGPHGAPFGFYVLHGDELNQFYVSRTARGTGAAKALLDDAEATLAQRGATTSWLACAIGNERAAHFYEKHGWRRDGETTIRLPVPGGDFDLNVWRYSKIIVPVSG